MKVLSVLLHLILLVVPSSFVKSSNRLYLDRNVFIFFQNSNWIRRKAFISKLNDKNIHNMSHSFAQKYTDMNGLFVALFFLKISLSTFSF